MASRTPTPMTPGRGSPVELDTESTRTQRLVDVGTDEPAPVTASRAVCPPAVVPNKRLPNTYGEAFLVWRCLDCGTVGSLDALPTRCVCGAHREELAYEVED